MILAIMIMAIILAMMIMLLAIMNLRMFLALFSDENVLCCANKRYDRGVGDINIIEFDDNT